MGSPSSISTFWLNFTNKRKNSHNESMWSRFHSPYDPPTPVGSDHCEFSPASSPVASSRHLRVLQSLPPVSPRPRTANGGFWRSPSSSSGKKSHPDCHTHPSALTAGEKENDTPPSLPVILRRFFGNSQKNTIQERVRRAKLRLSRSAEVLDDHSTADDPGCWGPKRRNSEMSKSTDELQKIKIRWMQKLDQCRVQFGPCKSDESFNIRPDRDMDDTTPDLSHIAVVNGQQSNSLSLNKIKKKVLQTPSPSPKRKNDQTTDTHSQRHKGPMSEDQKSGRRCEDAREQLDTRARGRTRSPRNANDGKDAAVIFTVDDQPPLTVRPGVSLTRSRSCTRPSRRALSTYSEPDYNSPTLNMRSTASSTLDDAQKKHAISEGDLRLRRSRSSQRPQPTKTPETDEEDLVFEPIPQVPELKLFRYNSERRSSRADRLKALSIFNHQPLGYLEEQTYPQNMSYSPEGRVTTDRDTYTTLQTPRTPRHILDTNSKTWSAKRSLFRSSSVRPGTEDPLSTSPFLSLLAHKRLTRGSLSDKVVLKQLASTVVNEDDSGLCRGLIFDGSTSARTGVFPASLVARRDTNVGGMSGRGKPTAAVKVSPPTVPDSAGGVTHRHSGSSFSSGVYSAGDQRSSYSSSVSDDNPPPSPRSPARGGGGCDHGQLGRLGGGGGGGVGGGGGGGGGGNNQLSTANNNNSNNNNNNNNNNNSPSHYHNQQFTFPAAPHQQQQMPQFAHLMCPKTSPGSPHHLPQDTNYYLTYQHQTSLEDQGIDVQSPGRSSPGSGSGSSTTGSTASSGGCRNSTTSLDSGRASTTTHSHQHRLSGQSYDSGSILRHSYHSSSSSLGSMEHDAATHVNVPELLNNGVRDSEVLRAWLTDLRLEEYYEKFISAGYDMPTISRMTPEDLNAIGITKPAHRKKLKAEITRLNISDGMPDFIPGRLEDWLSILRLEEYTASLKQQKYASVEQMTQLTWEDLEDIGITKLGHQKKVMLAIKRVKDIMAGKKFTSTQEPRQQSHYGTHEIMISREASEGRDQYASVPEFRTFSGPPGHYGNGEHNRPSGPAEPGVHYGVPTHYAPGVQYAPMPPPQAHVHPMAQQTGPFHPSNQFGAPQGPSPPGSKHPNVPAHPLPGPGHVQYRPDLVAVQVRPGGRGRSIESLEEPIYGTYQTFHPESRLPYVQGPMSLGSLPPRPFPATAMGPSHPQRSMDDGDITPTNEYANNYEGGGTLPRPRTANKLRPVAKVTAKTRVDVHEVPQFIKDGMNLKKPSQTEEINMKDLNIKELNLKSLNRQNSEKIYNSSPNTGSSNNTPQGTPKKIPPPPPRRSNSISETSKEAASQESQYGYLRRGLSYGYMGIKNNLQPDVTPDLPPPPAPPDSANHQHLPDDFPPPPPPLTCVTMASSTRITASSTITTSSITSDSLATSQTSTTSSEDDVSSGFRPRRNDSNASFKSTSSTDSESLPFANENAGTIKQRACRPHPGLTVLDTRNSPLSSPRSSPALRRKEAQPPLRQNPIATTDCTSGQETKSNSSSPDGTGDVLNDIGNMLANLTDELDAMLEQEVTLKN